jgi:hypothetical protein
VVQGKKGLPKLQATTEARNQLNGHLNVEGGSNMTGTDLCVNKPHCAAPVRP